MPATTSAGAYTYRCGTHPEFAGFTALLAEAGMRDPESGAPLSEALVLGISGGIGVGYILWEFKESNARILVMGMRNRWQYADSLYPKLSDRLGVVFSVAETGSTRGAQAALDAAFGLGRPALLWVDQAGLPWFFLPPSLSGHFGHTVVAVGYDDERVLIDDRTPGPWRLTRAQLAAARERIGSYKNRLVSVEQLGAPDLNAAIIAGIRDCAEHLSLASDSFSLPVLRKWARLMTDTKNAKGWPRVFADGGGLYGALISVFEGVTDYGTDGGSLRTLYADFLDEAARRLQQPALVPVAAFYRRLAPLWGSLGETALPTHVPALAAAKELIARRQTLLMALGSDGMEELAAVHAELTALRRQNHRAFPLDEAGRLDLFKAMQGEIEGIHAAEVEANRMLHEAAAAL
jgi:hypothetical protein